MIFFFEKQIDFEKIKDLVIAFRPLRAARGIGASYQSSAYSPTAVGKGANRRYCELAPFSTGGSP
ncbi:hypothetical protein B0E44_03455 [Flavobacterium sp. A45]|nr:hypothetical protein B0E44_03455 [Flavobacterium sp. A45]